MDQEIDSTGRKIRARNEKGEPICGRKKGNGEVCQTLIGLNADGLCTKHKNRPPFQRAPLSEREAGFAAYFCACFNATRAARLAGFPQRALASQGARLVRKPAVQEEVARIQLENAKRLTMDTGFMLLQLERIISFDVRNLYDAVGRSLSPHELDDDTAAAISALDMEVISRTVRGSGVKKWRFESKLSALQTALRIRGFLKDRVELDGDLSVLSEQELLEYERIKRKMSAPAGGDRG